MDYTQMMSEAKVLFYNSEHEEALELCKAAIASYPSKEDAYLMAGQIAFALGDPNLAAQFFSDLVKINPLGDFFYLLGQAQAMNDDGMNAINNFEKALQHNCSTENKGKIYKTMAMIDVEMGHYEDGLQNIENATEFVGFDLDLLKSRYLCYAGLQDYKHAISACNQMKLISPSSYEAYSMAFEILMDLEMYDEAGKELQRAKRSVCPLPQAYYDDKAKYVLISSTGNSREKLTDKVLLSLLNVYAAALNNLYLHFVDYDKAFSVVVRATQTYLQMNDGNNALRLVEILWNIPLAYEKKIPLLEFLPKSVEEMDAEYEAEFLYTAGALTDDERSENYEKVKNTLTPLKNIPGKKNTEEEQQSFEPYELEASQKEIIWGLEISAYDLLAENEQEIESAKHYYAHEMEAAKHLQGSQSINSNYLGKYTVLHCEKCLNADKWRIHYQNAIGFWKNQRLENPDDLLALSYEIRCLIDIEEYEEATKKIAKLPMQNRQFFEDLIKQKKVKQNDNN